ncbi:MAG: DUF4296 domain-containing protein [Bacteroidota bacterium]
MHKNIRICLSSLSLITSLIACKSNNTEAPINKEKMKLILLDVHFAESYSSMLKNDTLQKKSSNKNIDSLAVFYGQILEKHGISYELFDSAMNWYSHHPEELDSVYTYLLPVMDSLKTIPLKDTSLK